MLPLFPSYQDPTIIGSLLNGSSSNTSEENEISELEQEHTKFFQELDHIASDILPLGKMNSEQNNEESDNDTNTDDNSESESESEADVADDNETENSYNLNINIAYYDNVLPRDDYDMYLNDEEGMLFD
ncbi:hypothetical protein PVAND_006830 [Polypedilum vanderplanki]|uniref:Uncharacterized protein n=1 Tax=Polypedilum vanderplanki TaxID=319348 RepID=A0A9J6C620_POLVA|nr:hypothetical protein PVAND_006830 [Polypedilum vanderplanki]